MLKKMVKRKYIELYNSEFDYLIDIYSHSEIIREDLIYLKQDLSVILNDFKLNKKDLNFVIKNIEITLDFLLNQFNSSIIYIDFLEYLYNFLENMKDYFEDLEEYEICDNIKIMKSEIEKIKSFEF